MTSRGIIMTICWISMILYWTTDMFPGGIIPVVFCASFLMLEWTGMFKKELANYKQVNSSEPDERTERQKDFQRKLEEGKQNAELNDFIDVATINMVDQDGKHSSIVIKSNGEVITEGDPNPDIIKAAKMVHASILESGPEAIADEMAKQLEKILEGEDDGKS